MSITVKVMVGTPCSGKSSWVAKNKNDKTLVLSSDSLRIQKYGSLIEGNKHNGKIFDEIYHQIFINLNNPNINTIMFDATNLSRKRRKHLYSSIKKRDSKTNVEIVLCHASLQACLERNFARNKDERVPSDKLKQMYLRLDPPRIGVDCDKFMLQAHAWEDYKQEYSETLYLSHDNPFHMETIDEHLRKVAESLPNEHYSLGYFHDLGKSVCRIIPKPNEAKLFFEEKYGKPYNAFYCHEKVSAIYYLIASNVKQFTGSKSQVKLLAEAEAIFQHMNGYNITNKIINANKITDYEISLINMLCKADSENKCSWEFLEEYLLLRESETNK